MEKKAFVPAELLELLQQFPAEEFPAILDAIRYIKGDAAALDRLPPVWRTAVLSVESEKEGGRARE